MDKIRHCCYMIGEDLGITGLKAIENYPEKADSITKILFMVDLITQLQEKFPEKYEKRQKYVDEILIVNRSQP